MPKKKRRSKRIKPIYDGIEFDSNLELNHYKLIQSFNHVRLIDRQVSFRLLEGFKYTRFPDKRNCSYKDMIYTPDFIIEVDGFDKPIALESKGFARKDYAMRKKMFIKKYGEQYYFLESGSEKHLRALFEELM